MGGERRVLQKKKKSGQKLFPKIEMMVQKLTGLRFSPKENEGAANFFREENEGAKTFFRAQNFPFALI